MKRFFIGVLIVFVVFVIIGSFSNKKEVKEVKEVDNKTQETPMLIPVETLGDAFDENQVAAEKAWKGKLVQFSAKISNITDGKVSFYDVATDDYSGSQIGCKVKDNQQLLTLKNGETITVKGNVGDQFIGVITLDNCEVVE